MAKQQRRDPIDWLGDFLMGPMREFAIIVGGLAAGLFFLQVVLTEAFSYMEENDFAFSWAIVVITFLTPVLWRYRRRRREETLAPKAE